MFIVTSPLSSEVESRDLEQFLEESGLPYTPRRGKSLPLLMRETGAEGTVIWKPSGPVLQIGDQQFFFHPSMAKIRIGAYRKQGQVDPLVQACELRKGDLFLDCTLGLGADAIVASFFTRTGVIGLESSQVAAALVKWGMRCYASELIWLQEPIKRIHVRWADHYDYLSQQPSKSVDIVYFDPMFRKPVFKSQAISPLRSLADHRPLRMETIEEACRVARRRVVVKERSSGEEFKRLGIATVQMGSRSNLAYGIINI